MLFQALACDIKTLVSNLVVRRTYLLHAKSIILNVAYKQSLQRQFTRQLLERSANSTYEPTWTYFTGTAE